MCAVILSGDASMRRLRSTRKVSGLVAANASTPASSKRTAMTMILIMMAPLLSLMVASCRHRIGIHVEHLPQMAIQVLEAVLVHEAVVL